MFLLDGNDFDDTTLSAIFPAMSSQTNLGVPISIFDDEVDESTQFFIAHLVIVHAVNQEMISIGRDFSRCVIIDNDRE